MFRFGYRFFYLMAGGTLANLVAFGFTWSRAIAFVLSLLWATSCEHINDRDQG